jgi:hypothetical protein
VITSINLRKFFCSLARPGTWFYKLCDCQRYSPGDTIAESVEVTESVVAETTPPKAKYPLYVFIPELLVADGDLNKFCADFRKAGGWGIRFFLLQSWSTKRLVPWEQATSSGESIWIDIPEEHLRTPVTDMDKPNEAYWSRLDEVLRILKDHDLEAIVSLGDTCSMNTHEQFLSYPFLASLDTLSCEIIPYVVPVEAQSLCIESPGGLYGEAKYFRLNRWIEDACDAGVFTDIRIRYEPQNEFSKLGWTDNTPLNWYKQVMAVLDGNAVGAGDIIHSGDMDITLQFPGIYSMHGIERAGMYDFPGDYSRLMLSGDGGYAGPYSGRSETDVDIEGRQGLSVEDAREIARMIVEKGIMGGYEIMIKRMWRYDDCLANVDDIPMDVPQAMTDEWNKGE